MTTPPDVAHDPSLATPNPEGISSEQDQRPRRVGRPRKHPHSTTKGPQWSRDLATQARDAAKEAERKRAKALRASEAAKRRSGPPRPLNARQQRVCLDIARMAIAGATNPEMAAKVGIHEATVRKYRNHPEFLKAVERARSVLRTESEQAAEAGRVEALQAARAVLKHYETNPALVPPNTAMQAASIIISASAPLMTKAAEDRLRKTFLASLPPRIRADVVAAWRSSRDAHLDALTDEELEQLAAGDE